MFPKFVSCCLDAKIYKCMINCLYGVFFLFAFGQCPVLVKQITTNFFTENHTKSFGFSFNSKGTLEGQRKGFKISIQNRKQLKSGTETSKTAKLHPYLPKFL